MSLFEGVMHEEELSCLEVNGIKRYVTGLNEFAPEIKKMTPEKRGAKVKAYDPKAMEEAKTFYLKNVEGVEYFESKYEVLKNSEALILLTEWKEFRSPDFNEIESLLINPVIFDGRNQYNAFNLNQKGFEYYQIGKK